ncbi:MAG TPA: hypothetical protein VFC86_10725 [Planctomycetota bacterium]|nr:hypothetical protein [Planctomycetota bacterium]
MILLALILVLAPPQEGVDELIRQLTNEEVEVRIQAEQKLVKLGEPARAALVKAAASGTPELMIRATAILKTLDFHQELRAWLAPSARITLSGEKTLEEAVREIERQSSQKVTCHSWPEGKFRVDLKNVPYWEALESVCAASGARTLHATEAGPVLGGATYVKVPSSVSGSFCLRFDSLRESRRFDPRTAHESRSLALHLHLGWERSIAPAKTYLALEEIKDDVGTEYLAAFREYESRSSSGGAYFVKEAPPVYMKVLAKGSFATLPEKAATMSIKGAALVWIRASPDDLEIPIPAPGEVIEERIKICDTKLEEVGSPRLTLSEASRKGTTVGFDLTISGMDLRMMQDTWQLWHLKDRAGQKYVGGPRRVSRQNPGHPSQAVTYSFEFSSIPASAELSGFVIRIPKRVVALEIPFALKDIPLK